jgi:hypothetical protein
MRVSLSRHGLVALLLAVPFAGQGAEVIYRWVDANGQQHFSDVPREGAEEMVVASPQRYSPPATTAARAGDGGDGSGESRGEPAVQSNGYTNVAITSPSAEETIWNTGGTISVSVNLQPDLMPGHSIRILVDRQREVQLEAGSTSTTLSDIFRGTHQLEAQVLTANGDVIASSPSLTFYYKQTSVNRRP